MTERRRRCSNCIVNDALGWDGSAIESQIYSEIVERRKKCGKDSCVLEADGTDDVRMRRSNKSGAG